MLNSQRQWKDLAATLSSKLGGVSCLCCNSAEIANIYNNIVCWLFTFLHCYVSSWMFLIIWDANMQVLAICSNQTKLFACDQWWNERSHIRASRVVLFSKVEAMSSGELCKTNHIVLFLCAWLLHRKPGSRSLEYYYIVWTKECNWSSLNLLHALDFVFYC